MSIPLNLTHVQKKPQRLEGTVKPEELEMSSRDELIHINQQLRYELNADWMGDAVLVQGDVELPAECDCARCLKSFTHMVKLTGYALHLPIKGEDVVEIIDDCVDLTPYLREDILLALPQHPLCRTDCPGLQNEGEDAELNQPANDVWSALDDLKFEKD